LSAAPSTLISLSIPFPASRGCPTVGKYFKVIHWERLAGKAFRKKAGETPALPVANRWTAFHGRAYSLPALRACRAPVCAIPRAGRLQHSLARKFHGYARIIGWPKTDWNYRYARIESGSAIFRSQEIIDRAQKRTRNGPAIVFGVENAWTQRLEDSREMI
jgi:hypothetical protein